MCADVHRNNEITFDIENDAQVALNIHRIDGSAISRRETVDFVRAQPGIERVSLENSPGPPRGLFLAGS